MQLVGTRFTDTSALLETILLLCLRSLLKLELLKEQLQVYLLSKYKLLILIF